MKKTAVLIADDHAIVRFGLASLINAQRDMEVVAEARNGEEAVEKALALKPDIAVLDLAMPRMDGAEAAARLRKRLPGCKVVILTSFGTHEGINRAIDNGAVAALTKTADDEDLTELLRRVNAGERIISPEIRRDLQRAPAPANLTERQRKILCELARGLSNKDIALLLNTSPIAIRDQLHVIFGRIGAANRAEAVAIAYRHHLLKP